MREYGEDRQQDNRAPATCTGIDRRGASQLHGTRGLEVLQEP